MGGRGSFPTTYERRISLTIIAIGFTHLIISKWIGDLEGFVRVNALGLGRQVVWAYEDEVWKKCIRFGGDVDLGTLYNK